ncbi:MAG: class I SAM-dependent methyltransferase [Chloroflexi bacterium]|nr:class I SAM-dependent methyltransferase [Chloroflexota bacterium]
MSSSVAMTPALEQVKQYWEWYMQHVHVEGEEFGSKGYFAAIDVDHKRSYGIANDLLDLSRIRGKKLLEIAPGIGLDTVVYAKHGADVTAVDISPMALDLARKNLDHNGVDAKLEIGDAENLRFADNSFDFVVARGILMFTPDDQKVVEEIRRVLEPGGEAQILLHKRFSWYVMLGKLSRTNLVQAEKEPPINRLYAARDARRLCAAFSSVKLSYGRLPMTTKRNTGLSRLFNRVVVPATRVIPKALLRQIGYYIIVRAVK